jgi:hypothetical protein
MKALYNRLSWLITMGAFLALGFNACSVIRIIAPNNGEAQYKGHTEINSSRETGTYMVDSYFINYYYPNRKFFSSQNNFVNSALSPQRYLWREGKNFSECPTAPRAVGWQLYYVGIPCVLFSLLIYSLFRNFQNEDGKITIGEIIISVIWNIIATYNTFILFWWIYQWYNGNALIESSTFFSQY